MEAGVVSRDESLTSPLTEAPVTSSLPHLQSSPLSPPPMASPVPPARPCRPKPPPPAARSSQLPSRPPLPPSTPPVCRPSDPTPPPSLPPPISPTPIPDPASPSPQPPGTSNLTPSSPLPPPLTPTVSPPPPSPVPAPSPAVTPPHPPAPSMLSLMDRLAGSASIWQTRELSQDQANGTLANELAGAFLVHSEDDKGVMTLSVCQPGEQGQSPVHNLKITHHNTLLHLDGSFLLFDDIVKLVAFYCVSRDILAVPLRLPQAVSTATTREELEVISAMGADFWTSDLNQQAKKQADQDGGGLYLRLNPVCVEGSKPSEDPPSLGCDVAAPLNASSSLQNGETPQKVPQEVKGHSKSYHGQEIKYKRPPPRPPSLSSSSGMGLLFTSPPSSANPATDRKEEGKARGGEREERKSMTTSPPPSRPPVPLQSRSAPPLPPAPVRRTSSKKSTEGGDGTEREKGQNTAKDTDKEGAGERGEKKTEAAELESCTRQEEELNKENDRGDEKEEDQQQSSSQGPPAAKRPTRPVPPPRRKPCPPDQASSPQSPAARPGPPSPVQRPDVSLYSPQGGAALGTDPDSCSTSSAEEEGEPTPEQEQNHNRPSETRSPKVTVRRTPTTVMLDRARYRLSTVINGLISHERRLTQRIVELARDPLSYFGNLVKEHRAFTLETMCKHSSSTELLQEIRQMMTQLKSYLLQSTELQNMMEAQHQYAQDKLESIVEAALCKSVLKPLREPIYRSLENLHTANGSLKQLAQNQSVVLGSTTTALGVTTAVPEASAMEKISIKLNNLHLEYSPQKKIDILLKACKIIYDSMSVSCPGRAHGADDFLPVMMYVLARSNLSALQLDVEYMMELMDPALTIGEGSYYLTTTYGALEHIKCFDQQRSATRQLSREVQDSIHRWERRRTLNQERMTQISVQDFLTVCSPEIGSDPKTLGVLPTTTIQQLAEQCAARFEQDSYTLSLYIDGVQQPLIPTELALSVKSSCKPGAYWFVYHPVDQPGKPPGRSCPTDPPPLPPADICFQDMVENSEPDAEDDSLICL